MPLRVAFLLPEDPVQQLLNALPESAGDVEIMCVKHNDEALASNLQIDAICWVPPCNSGRLAAMLEAHPETTWVHSFSAGVDYIAGVIKSHMLDRPTLALSNGRGAFSESLGEYTIAAAFHFTKQFKRCDQNRREKKWDKFVMPVLRGKTMGFVGWGHIAKTTARLAAPLGLRLVALRRNPERPAEAGDPALAGTYGGGQQAEFYAQCDFVVCTLPLTDETRGAVDVAAFGAMKPGAVFISIGRGAAVDETALCEALRTGQIAGAACDVFATEPLPADSPLWLQENLLMTAHNADLTEDYFGLAVQTWRDNLECFRSGTQLATPVDKASGY